MREREELLAALKGTDDALIRLYVKADSADTEALDSYENEVAQVIVMLLCTASVDQVAECKEAVEAGRALLLRLEALSVRIKSDPDLADVATGLALNLTRLRTALRAFAGC